MTRRDPLCDLMLPYARHGFRDWREEKSEVQSRAKRCLPSKIFENLDQINYHVGNGHSKDFVPIPKQGYGSEIERSFFLPRKDDHNWTFVLFILLKEDKNLAFRFEAANRDGDKHDYAHMQFCRDIWIGREKFNPLGIPSWIPQSDPAFLLPSSDPLKLFLTMLVSIHGDSKTVKDIIKHALQEESRVTKWKDYADILDKMLENPTRCS